VAFLVCAGVSSAGSSLLCVASVDLTRALGGSCSFREVRDRWEDGPRWTSTACVAAALGRRCCSSQSCTQVMGGFCSC
jgi:hypothetical protein